MDKNILERFSDWFQGITGFAVYQEKNLTITVGDEAEEIEVQYYTEAPTSAEEEISKDMKRIVISSDVHYKNVMAYMPTQCMYIHV